LLLAQGQQQWHADLLDDCSPTQAIQDRIKQLEAAAAAAAAAADARMSDLRIELEAERAEARRAKMEAASTAKQFEQLVQRLRREADASKLVGAYSPLFLFVQAWV
jgi:hypothetical protein